MTLPTLTCLLDDGTGSFPYNISSKVLFADGFSFSRGRADWQGAVTAGQLTLTLNNSDGRFTAGSTTIASPSPIRVDQRIRIKETINGITLTRFTGYVKSWPVAWPATVSTFATTQILVTDAQARAERRTLRSVVEEEILADAPAAYYTLGEPAGATSAADSSGNQQPKMGQFRSGSYSFGTGTGPGTDSLTALQVPTGVGNSGALSTAITTAYSAITLEMFYSGTDKPPGGSGDAYSLLSANGYRIQVAITETGKVIVFLAGGGSLTSTTTVTDGLMHHIALTHTGTTATLYIDATAEVTVANALTPGASGWDFQIGMGISIYSFGFTAAHVVAYASALSAARVAAHSSSGSTGFSGESGTARLTRLAGYAGIPLGTLDASLTNVPFVDFTGASEWDTQQQVVDAEGGVAFIDENGALEFHNRNRNPAKTSPDLTISATSYITPDVQPVLDDQQMVNYFEATATGTGVTQVVRNTTSELGDGTATNPGHGRYSQSAEYLVSTDPEALDRANWIVANFADPTTRYGTLTINLYAMPAALAQTVVAAVDIDCWLRVTNLGSQNPGGTTADVVVEGFTENCSENTWTLVCNVVSRSLFSAWILGDSTYSVLGSTTRLYI